MFYCEICNNKADIHHIVHRSEGGLDIAINYKYLCEEHHRGKDGPHNCLETDLKYKIELQNKLYKLLPKAFYPFKDLLHLLNLSTNTLKKITKELKLYKEGYKKEEVILFLMGGKSYTDETLENYKLELLFNKLR